MLTRKFSKEYSTISASVGRMISLFTKPLWPQPYVRLKNAYRMPAASEPWEMHVIAWQTKPKPESWILPILKGIKSWLLIPSFGRMAIISWRSMITSQITRSLPNWYKANDLIETKEKDTKTLNFTHLTVIWTLAAEKKVLKFARGREMILLQGFIIWKPDWDWIKGDYATRNAQIHIISPTKHFIPMIIHALTLIVFGDRALDTPNIISLHDLYPSGLSYIALRGIIRIRMGFI